MILKIGSYILTPISPQYTKYSMNIIEHNIDSSFALLGNGYRILGSYLTE